MVFFLCCGLDILPIVSAGPSHPHVTRQVTALLNPPSLPEQAAPPVLARVIPPRPQRRHVKEWKEWCRKFDPEKLQRFRDQQKAGAKRAREKEREKYSGRVTKSMQAEKEAKLAKERYFLFILVPLTMIYCYFCSHIDFLGFIKPFFRVHVCFLFRLE